MLISFFSLRIIDSTLLINIDYKQKTNYTFFIEQYLNRYHP